MTAEQLIEKINQQAEKKNLPGTASALPPIREAIIELSKKNFPDAKDTNTAHDLLSALRDTAVGICILTCGDSVTEEDLKTIACV